MNMLAPSLSHLNLSRNRLSHIPLCICTFTTLTHLDLSDNPDIKTLPYEMGILTNLVKLNLNGLKNLKDPPTTLICTNTGPGDCIHYLRNKLHENANGSHSMQLMIVGDVSRGKSTLAAKLHGKKLPHNQNARVHIHEWKYKPNLIKRVLNFRIWDFSSITSYRATHPSLLSQSSLYIILYNLKHGSNGVHEIKNWLDHISKVYSNVIIVGTHLDEIPSEERYEFDLIEQQVEMLMAAYERKVHTVGIFSVSLKGNCKNFNKLLKCIYQHALSNPPPLEGIIFSIRGNMRSDELSILLNQATNNLTSDFLNHALAEATHMDNADNVAQLVLAGAQDIDKCLSIATQEKKPYSRTMLLLIKAAQIDDQFIVEELFGYPTPHLTHKQYFVDCELYRIQAAILLADEISVEVPLKIASSYGNAHVREALLFQRKVNQEECYVYWDGLQLVRLEIGWLRNIAWVNDLNISRNGLKTLQPEIATYLKQVIKIDLSYNDLDSIPSCLLELPRLSELLLSNNKLIEIPNIEQWSVCLTTLDLSHNNLHSLPSVVAAPIIKNFNLANNRLHSVPLCICSFNTLQTLDLSNNQEITLLPLGMGKLSNLVNLNLDGLKNLQDPPKYIQNNCRDCITYLYDKLCNTREFYHMKLMVVGNTNRGKSTLVAHLLGKEYVTETAGICVSEWWYRPNIGRKSFHFRIWDFAGKEHYYATFQCFLSQHSIYLLLFNLKYGNEGIKELKPWLNSISLRAPHSCVIIVGTHLDEVADDERGEIDALLHRVGSLCATYHKLKIVEVLPVGLKNCIENINLLKEAIYNHAANYTNQAGQLLMGQKMPSSYHALYKHLQVVQQEVRQGLREPIMHVKEFQRMVHQMNLEDLEDDEELKVVTVILTDVGSLLHFDDHRHNLHELYFVDPSWLCEMMSKVVTIKRSVDGIINRSDIPSVLKGSQFLLYYEQYLTLLDKFEIALPIDKDKILVPAMLPDEGSLELDDEFAYTRKIIFNSAYTPSGFWSRLLSMIMYTTPKVYYVLNSNRRPLPMKQGEKVNDKCPEIEFGNTHDTTDPQVPSTSISIIEESTDANTSQENFRRSNIPINYFFGDFDPRDIHLEYWRTGLHYRDPEIFFRIEALHGTKQSNKEENGGILIVASTNNFGKKIISQLVDLAVSYTKMWYPHLQKRSGLEQRIPCFECIKEGRERPYEFSMEQCRSIIAKYETVAECGYISDCLIMNHWVSLGDLVPDLLLKVIDPEFLLDSEEINYQEDDTSLLGKGGYGKVYRGKCQGKSVAIKKFISRTEEAFRDLCSEAMLLQQLKHPCIIRLIGVCAPVQPLMALVLEEAPFKSLEFPILKKKIPIHRLTTFRIAAEVAAALHFLHSHNIIYRNLKACNILLWTLNPDSLCHCKLSDFGTATHFLPNTGTRGVEGTKGFIAPEVLYINKRQECSVYDHRVDIFSFSMFLYQMIARRHPYHNIPPHRRDMAVLSGECPKLQDVDVSHTGYHYLTKVMQACWEYNPENRLDTDTIIKKVCQSSTQMVMCVAPISGKQSLRRAIAVTPSTFAKSGHPKLLQSELWVCCDGVEGAEVSMLNTHSMVKVNQVFIKDNQVQCMALCGDHVWVASRAGIEYGVLDIFSVGSRELVHNVQIPESSVTCITATDTAVYLGTLEGCCFSFHNNISTIHANVKPRYKYISEHAVDGIICTKQCVWVAHTRYIYFLKFDNLALDGSVHREKERDAYIGQMSFDPDHNIIWSAHLGGVILSAWDAHNKNHVYDIDTGRNLKRIISTIDDANCIMTAMTLALDTVWVGMATGHIMVFYKEELLSWFHPYEGCVRFLTCIPSSGPCEMEKAMVASGGKNFIPLVEGLDIVHTHSDKSTEISTNNPNISGTVIIWEAYEAKTMKQVKLLEEISPHHLDNHHTVRRTIHQGEFRDDTHINSTSSDHALPYYDNIAYTPGKEAQPLELSQSFRKSLTMNPARTDSLRNRNTNFFTEREFSTEWCSSENASRNKDTNSLITNNNTLVTESTKKKQSENGLDSPIIQEIAVAHSRHNLDCPPGLYHDDISSLATSTNHHCKPKAQSVEHHHNQHMHTYMKQEDDLRMPLFSLDDEPDDVFTNSNSPPQNSKNYKLQESSIWGTKLDKRSQSFSLGECSAPIDSATSKSSVTQDVTLSFKLYNSEHTLDMNFTKPLRLETVLNDLQLIANLGDQDWQLIYSVDESHIKIETQEDFDKFLSMNNAASIPTLWITDMNSF